MLPIDAHKCQHMHAHCHAGFGSCLHAPACVPHVPCYTQELAGALASVVQAGGQGSQGVEARERCARALQSLQRIVQAPGTPTPPEGTQPPPPELLQMPAELALPAGYA